MFGLKLALIGLLFVGSCLGYSYQNAQFPRVREIPYACSPYGVFRPQRCYVIVDFFTERFECYSINSPYQIFNPNGEYNGLVQSPPMQLHDPPQGGDGNGQSAPGSEN